MDILTTVKMLLGITDGSEDEKLNYYIIKVTNAILDYCNRDDLPERVKPLVIDKVVALYKNGRDAFGVGQVSTITRGDATIEYASASSKGTSNSSDILSDMEAILSRYRQVKVV